MFDKDKIVRQRMKIIKFYEQYREKTTREASGADTKVISRWRNRLKEGTTSFYCFLDKGE